MPKHIHTLMRFSLGVLLGTVKGFLAYMWFLFMELELEVLNSLIISEVGFPLGAGS